MRKRCEKIKAKIFAKILMAACFCVPVSSNNFEDLIMNIDNQNSENEVYICSNDYEFVNLNGKYSTRDDPAQDVILNQTDDSKKKVVALIDTGVNNFADKAINFTDDSDDDINGHGTTMAKYMLETSDNNIDILSLKAIGDDGKGEIKDVINAVQCAIDEDVDIINLSIAVKDTDDNSKLKNVIQKAIEKGIKVVASSGNDGALVDDYAPANISGVITVGSCDADGNVRKFSNYGKKLDYFVISDSTSEAAAKFSGWLASGNENDQIFDASKVIEPTLTKTVDYSRTDQLSIQSEWYEDYHYGLDETNNILTLDAYNGNGTVLTVPGTATVEGKTYSVKLKSTDGVSTAGIWYGKASQITSITFETGVILPTNCSYMFNGCSALTTLDLSSINMAGVTVATDMLAGTTNLNEIKTPLNLTSEVSLSKQPLFDLGTVTSPNYNSSSTVAALPTSLKESHLLMASYTMTFNGNGGSSPENEYAAPGHSAVLPASTRSGYQFSGWYDAAENGNKIGNAGDAYIPSANITIYAQWTKLVYTLNTGANFNASAKTLAQNINKDFSDADSVIKSISFYADGTVPAGITLTSLNHVNVGIDDANIITAYFDGSTGAIYVCSEGTIKINSNVSYMFSNMLGLTSVDLSLFDMSGVTDSTSMFAGTSKLVNIKSPLNLTANISLAVSLYDLGEITGPDYNSSSSTTVFPLNLKVSHLLMSSNQVSFDGNGGSSAAAEFAVTGYSIVLPESTRTGYTFNGWYDAVEGGNLIGTTGVNYAPMKDTVLYAQWTINTYKITYDAGTSSSGVLPAEQAAAYNSAVEIASNKMEKNQVTENHLSVTFNYSDSQENSISDSYKTRTYTADGWSLTSDSTEKNYNSNDSYTMQAGDITLYPFFAEKLSQQSSIILPSPNARPGHTFVGWYDAAENGNKIGDAGSEYTPSADVILYAHWAENQVAIQYASSISDGGTVSRSSETAGAATGTLQGSLAVPNTGYHFVNWTDSTNLEVSKETLYVPAKISGLNVSGTYTANFAPNSYTVRFHSATNGTGTMGDESYKYGEEKNLTSNQYLLSGFIFEGWSTTDGGSIVYSDQQLVKNLTVDDGAVINLYAVYRQALPTGITTESSSLLIGLGLLVGFVLILCFLRIRHSE